MVDPALPVTRSRRGFIATVAGAAAALVFGVKFSDATTDDYCHWRRIQGPICSGHQVYEYRCEYCCTGFVCEQVTCAWFVTGSC